MTLSYFTGEQHSENFEQIIFLAEKLGYSVRVYESKEANQFDFLQAVDKIGKYPIYDKYLTPMAIAAGIKPIHAENPTLDVSRMQNPPIEFV